MKLLAVHPSGLMYTRVFLTLEPLGLELIAAAARNAGHEVRICDLQVEPQRNFFRALEKWQPDAVCFSGNYLANIPEIVDLAKAAKVRFPQCFVFAGGHSVSFTAEDLLEHAEGAIDCVLIGEGEASVAQLLAAVPDRALVNVPGAISSAGAGPPPAFVHSLDDLQPARDLTKHRRRYFIGTLDPCASMEFSRGCPWDCTFCSAWTFYGRSYRAASPEAIADQLAHIREPGIFIVDDVAFVHKKHAFAVADALRTRGIRKEYYLETRCDVLLRNTEVFRTWRELGLTYMFLGIESTDEETLKRFRKRSSNDTNMEALAFARELGIAVAINIIADPGWDRARFAALRRWCLEIPEIVNVSVATPYPGTEIWETESRKLISRDYRLFDIQHAVLPTALPLEEFYEELVNTQRVLNEKHFGWRVLKDVAGLAARQVLHGQTNFIRSLFKYNSVYDPELQLADHRRQVRYELRLPSEGGGKSARASYIHAPAGKARRALDAKTEAFVESTRIAAA